MHVSVISLLAFGSPQPDEPNSTVIDPDAGAAATLAGRSPERGGRGEGCLCIERRERLLADRILQKLSLSIAFNSGFERCTNS
ncbi:hypothetical protein MOX02_55300 [Methylobacterium oxalidis]|uniref:Uncharacterized protein n=1 Tax=Methylobacterium oxalidis TaxID=944322 RepID=A0A512JC00_9HYPH|nr:hypothetical protein MOX02_55300 [Methylobacterium oxalidis]GLS66057.1 hypothetical protein GCM10007888_44390 [Methylobacterium oxalidis]